jgi:hypothetical protein
MKSSYCKHFLSIALLILATSAPGLKSQAVETPMQPTLPPENLELEKLKTLDKMLIPKSSTTTSQRISPDIAPEFYFASHSHIVASFGISPKIGSDSSKTLNLGLGFGHGSSGYFELFGEIYQGEPYPGSIELRYLKMYNRSEFRPYLAGGLALFFQPSDQLLNFIRAENYQARATCGADLSFSDSLALRTEVSAMIGTQVSQLRMMIGLLWAMD